MRFAGCSLPVSNSPRGGARRDIQATGASKDVYGNDDKSSTIVVFDTYCVVCSSWVHFLLRHERDQTMRFVSAWSDEGTQMAARHGLTADDLDETYLVIEGDRGLVRSDAGIALMGHLSMPWRALRILSIFPCYLRDIVYAFIARNRYRWFGHCALFRAASRTKP